MEGRTSSVPLLLYRFAVAKKRVSVCKYEEWSSVCFRCNVTEATDVVLKTALGITGDA
jgi:hypothetical protein